MRRPNLAVSTSLVQDNIPAPIECCEKIYIGSIHAAFNIDKIKELGITHILNASGLPPTYPRNFSYLSVEVRDKSYASILGCIPATNIFIEAGLEQGGGVLVHCAGGRSRSAALIMAFLMSSQKLDFDTALAQCVKARDLVNVNPGFQIQLRAYAAADCDVHTAHQILLHKRLERFGERLQRTFKYPTEESISEDKKESFEDAVGEEEGVLDTNSATSTNNDEFGLNKSTKFEAKVESVLSLLDSPSSTVQPRLRLSRPASPAIQVIPPLRALERTLSCRRCAHTLFTYANVVLLDINHGRLDHVGWAQQYVMKHAKGTQPFASPTGLSPNPSRFTSTSKNDHDKKDKAVAALNMVGLDLDGEDTERMPIPIPEPSSTRGGGSGNGGFGRVKKNSEGGGGFGRIDEGAGDSRASRGFGRTIESNEALAEAKDGEGSPHRTPIDAKETSDYDPPSQPPSSLHRNSSSNSSSRSSPVVPVLNFSCGNRYDVRKSISSSFSVSSSTPVPDPSTPPLLTANLTQQSSSVSISSTVSTRQNAVPSSTNSVSSLTLNLSSSNKSPSVNAERAATAAAKVVQDQKNETDDRPGEKKETSPVISTRSATTPMIVATRRGSFNTGGGGNSARSQNSARSSGSNWSTTPPESARSNGNKTPRAKNFRPQSAEKERWLRRLQVLEHPNMIRTDTESGGGGHAMISSSEALKPSDRASLIAQADEDCQRALHSQVDTGPWKAIHQHYREAVSALEAPDSPLKLTDINSPPMVEGEVWSREGSMDLGSTPKAFFLEPMPWMNLSDLQNGKKTEGVLTCPNCQCELGNYRYDHSATSPSSLSSSSSVPVPRFIVMRRYVCANALPSEVLSSRESTPRGQESQNDGNDVALLKSNSDTALQRLSSSWDSEAKTITSGSTLSSLKKDGDDDE